MVDKYVILDRSSLSPSGCWLWDGPKNGNGYGKIGAYLAHRASYEAFFGEFDKKLCVLHSCDTPACVNPDHLSLGTQTDNMRQRDERGRCSKGEGCGKNKYLEKDILLWRRMYSNGYTFDQISAQTGALRETIRQAVRKKTWKHI